jgi:hypothetical protein
MISELEDEPSNLQNQRIDHVCSPERLKNATAKPKLRRNLSGLVRKANYFIQPICFPQQLSDNTIDSNPGWILNTVVSDCE